MMKKLVFVGLAGMLALLIVACGGSTTPTSVPATEAPTEEATAEAQVATEEVIETEAATEEAAETQAATEEAAETQAATEEAVAATIEPTEEAAETQAATEEVVAATSEVTEAATSEEIVWTCPEDFAGQTLSIFNWATYIGENTVADFERLCNVTVNYDTFDNNEAMIARLRQGNPGYDVAFANTYAIEILNREGLIEKIDPANVPNLKNIGKNFLNLDFDPDNTLSIPYLTGTMGIAVNTEKVTEPITSWQQVFDYDGPVAWIDDSRGMLGIALQLTGADPNSTNAEEIQAAKDYLVEHSGNVTVIASDDGQTLLERGEVDIAIEYSGDVYQLILQSGSDKFAYFIPEEGSVADLAVMFAPKDAPNVRLAEAFMDYILDPKVNADIVEFTTYATPNQAAIDSGLIDEALLTNAAVFPTAAMMTNMFFTEDVADAEQLFNDAWDELVIQVGS